MGTPLAVVAGGVRTVAACLGRTEPFAYVLPGSFGSLFDGAVGGLVKDDADDPLTDARRRPSIDRFFDRIIGGPDHVIEELLARTGLQCSREA